MAGQKLGFYTVTGLKRWSCIAKELPPISQVKALHVYDFDNTLFKSPLPNAKLWSGETAGFLQSMECFANGGWWHDSRILEATGQGIEKEEPMGWKGSWNEQVVELVELSIKQTGVLTILLTGRAEDKFADLLRRIVASKNLAFDMICLKPQAGPSNQTFSSTMNYKQAILRDLLYTYKDADEIRLYEDRVKHTRAFRDYFESINKALHSPSAERKPINAEVIQVADAVTTLDPVAETAEVQRMINDHNTAINSGSHALYTPLEIKRKVFFTGYLISSVDTTRLLKLVNLPPGLPESEVRFLADNIIITPRPCPRSILDKVGGIGRKQTWQVASLGSFESRVWAARVTPIPSDAPYHTDNPFPLVVLAVVKGSRPHEANRIHNWQAVPLGKQIVFQTEVGEKVQLRVGPEIEGEGEYENLYVNKNLKRNRDYPDGPPQFERNSYRPQYNDENRRANGANGANGGYRGGNQSRGRGGSNNASNNNNNNNNYQSRQARGRGAGNNRAANRGRGGGRGGYKSLDDVQNNSRYANQGSSYQPNYDDGPSNLAAGADGYNSSFPALGSGGSYNASAQGNGDGGLPYGK